MSNYHTQSLAQADVYTIMGSIYAEVARYDSALEAGHKDLAQQAASRAKEIMNFAQKLHQINPAQKMELKQFGNIFLEHVKAQRQTKLDSYLLPFAIAARMRQFK